MFRKNTASQHIYFQGVDSSTGGIKSGVTWTVRRCIDGTFGAGGGTVTEDGSTGWYKYAMSQADTNGNNIGFNFTGTGAVPQTVNIVTTDLNPYDSVRAGLTALPNAAAGANTGLPVVGTQVPNATAGAAGGLFIAGTNAPVTITGAGTALTLTSSSGNGHGLAVSGNGSGEGISATGGATGHGMQFTGGATSGRGIDITSPNEAGIQVTAGGTQSAINLFGSGFGSGIYSQGGDSGSGITSVGGSASGNGIHTFALASGHGILAEGNDDGEGGGEFHGISATTSSQDGHGISATGSGTGDGIRATGGASAGGDGIEAVAGGGVDIRGAITGNITGDLSGLSSAAVDQILDEVVEGSTTLRELLRGFASALLAKASGLETTTAVFRDLADSKDRITATVDADGNRSAVTLDLT